MKEVPDDVPVLPDAVYRLFTCSPICDLAVDDQEVVASSEC